MKRIQVSDCTKTKMFNNIEIEMFSDKTTEEFSHNSYEKLVCCVNPTHPRSRMERTSTVTGSPSPARNPAHSSAMYEAPTMSVRPGDFGSEKSSSDVIAFSVHTKYFQIIII